MCLEVCSLHVRHEAGVAMAIGSGHPKTRTPRICESPSALDQVLEWGEKDGSFAWLSLAQGPSVKKLFLNDNEPCFSDFANLQSQYS